MKAAELHVMLVNIRQCNKNVQQLKRTLLLISLEFKVFIKHTHIGVALSDGQKQLHWDVLLSWHTVSNIVARYHVSILLSSCFGHLLPSGGQKSIDV